MDTEKLDLNLLLALDALLAEQNVTRAAKRLNLSQPALSARLARLRDLFGDQLLTPTQRGMAPTARALQLQEPLRDALERVRSVLTDGVSFEPETAKLTVSLAGTDYIQYAVIAPLTLRLMRVAPKIQVVARQLSAQELPKQLERGEVDLAFLLPGTAGPSLRQRKLFDERYVVAVRKNHPKASRTLTLDTFCELDHIIVSPLDGTIRTSIDTQLVALGRQRHVQMSVPNFLVAPEVVARSDMAFLSPERLVRHRGDALKFYDPPFTVEGFTMMLAWHDRTHNHPAYNWLREQIVSVASEDGI